MPGAGDAAGTEAEELPDLLEPAARGAVQEVTGLGDSTHAMSWTSAVPGMCGRLL